MTTTHRSNAPRAAAQDQTAAALGLMERVLRDGRPMASEYPLVFDGGAPGRVEVIDEGDAPASACAWLRRDLLTPGGALPVALVGSVATREDARGRGLGTDVVDRAIDRAAEAGAAIALLWADDPAWYQERGWVPFGSEFLHVVEDGWAFLLPDPVGVRTAAATDAQAIHALYAQHLARVDRTAAETRTMLGVPAMRTVVAEQGGRVVGYACMGRGEDLMNVVHEWGGAPDAVLACISQLWRDAGTERLYVMRSETDVDLAAYFDFVKAPGARGILAMARIANVERLRDVFDRATPGDVTVTVAQASEPALDFTSPRGELRLTGHELLLGLCPPRGDARVTEILSNELATDLPDLPLQPFCWGLDSI